MQNFKISKISQVVWEPCTSYLYGSLPNTVAWFQLLWAIDLLAQHMCVCLIGMKLSGGSLALLEWFWVLLLPLVWDNAWLCLMRLQPTNILLLLILIIFPRLTGLQTQVLLYKLYCRHFSWSLGTKIVAILGIWSSQRFKDHQLYVIYKYDTSSNVGFVASITYQLFCYLCRTCHIIFRRCLNIQF